jgi:hypothetical protein
MNTSSSRQKENGLSFREGKAIQGFAVVGIVNWPLCRILFQRVRHSGKYTVPAVTYRYVFGLGVYPGRMYCQASPSELALDTLFQNRNQIRVVVPCLSAHPRPDSRVGKTGTRAQIWVLIWIDFVLVLLALCCVGINHQKGGDWKGNVLLGHF